MKSFFDRFGKKFGNARERMSDYWRRLMNHSTEKKISQGSSDIAKTRTVAHKDQWRRGDRE